MKTRYLIIIFLSCLTLSCKDDFDDVIDPSETADIQNFVWRAMHELYLYKEDSPDLANDRFASSEEFSDFLKSNNSPEELFDHLLASQDRFSIIVDDYTALENRLDGLTKTTGIRISFIQESTSNQVFGFIRYVLPGSSAAEKGLKRGMIFDQINGETLTAASNFQELTSGENYSIRIAEFSDDELISTDETLSLQKRMLQENPIYYSDVLDFNTAQIGYLVYNNFRGEYDAELNAVFQNFQTDNIDELIIDLRYNTGGDVESCKDLASMITGQYNNQIFAKQKFNANFDPVDLLFDTKIRNGEQINSLGLSQVYILTSRQSASASELLINSLNAYIDVIQVGETTVGKFEASRTLYDAPNYSRRNANIGHTYALQPLISKLENANGHGDYVNGLVPQHMITENFKEAKAFGDPSETLLLKTLNIMGVSNEENGKDYNSEESFEILFEDYQNQPSYQRMYSPQ
ncbi:MAG: S41 family peptidase [Psychroflexus sp.]|nr:S41 family peptidase [Psychroflexus sp.]MDN6309667.1 S41 family peptidase [Psychroflexus sp.]